MTYRRHRSKRTVCKNRRSMRGKRVSRKDRRSKRGGRKSRRVKKAGQFIGSNNYEFTITDAFVKEVGRGKPSFPLKPNNVEHVFPTDEGHKSTIGFELIDEYNHTEAFKGVHMTGAMLTNKNDLSEVQKYADASAYIGATVTPIGYTFFGPNCVIPLKFSNATETAKFSELNAVGTPEGQTDKRVWHVSVPLKQDAVGNWVKRFDDVSDEKFEFWKNVVTSVPCLVGKNDNELLAIIHA